MQQNIQNSINELTDLKTGVGKHTTQWVNVLVKEADINGIGFMLKMQTLSGTDGFEIEKSTTVVLAHFINTYATAPN